MSVWRRSAGTARLGTIDDPYYGPAPAARDVATRAYIADLQNSAAVSASYVARMGSSDPVVRAVAYTDWNAENAAEVGAARAAEAGLRRASAAAQTTQSPLRAPDNMDAAESLAADLGAHTRSIDEPTVDLETRQRAVVAAKSAASPLLGLTPTIHAARRAVSVTAKDAFSTDAEKQVVAEQVRL